MNTLSMYLKNIVYGGNDGIVTTFAVVAGFAGANSGDVVTFSFLAVLLFGFANLFADATSMGLGNFLSLRAERKVFEKEQKNIQKILESQKGKCDEITVNILLKKGFDEDTSKKMLGYYKKNKNYWADFLMAHHKDMPNPENISAFKNGLATFFSFMVFGLIPLLPYIFLESLGYPFLLAIIFTFAALMLLGLLRWKVTGEDLLASIVETVGIGSISAVIAFFVGMFFRG